MITNPTRGRGWAYTGAGLGGAVSTAANVAHSYVPPADAPTDWHPHLGAVVGAVFWPIALFVVVEIFARIAWPAGLRWYAVRFGGLLPVACVAAIVSYRHLSGLLTFYGEDPLTAIIGPLAVDGLMVMASGALVATGNHHPTPTAKPTPSPASAPAPAPTPASAPASAPGDLSTPVQVITARSAPSPQPVGSALPTHLLPAARYAATNHHATTGRPITADELAARISIPTDLAGQLLTLVDTESQPARVNGATTALTTALGGHR